LLKIKVIQTRKEASKKNEESDKEHFPDKQRKIQSQMKMEVLAMQSNYNYSAVLGSNKARGKFEEFTKN